MPSNGSDTIGDGFAERESLARPPDGKRNQTTLSFKDYPPGVSDNQDQVCVLMVKLDLGGAAIGQLSGTGLINSSLAGSCFCMHACMAVTARLADAILRVSTALHCSSQVALWASPIKTHEYALHCFASVTAQCGAGLARTSAEKALQSSNNERTEVGEGVHIDDTANTALEALQNSPFLQDSAQTRVSPAASSPARSQNSGIRSSSEPPTCIVSQLLRRRSMDGSSAGGLELGDCIGAGSFGRVYKGMQSELCRSLFHTLSSSRCLPATYLAQVFSLSTCPGLRKALSVPGLRPACYPVQGDGGAVL